MSEGEMADKAVGQVLELVPQGAFDLRQLINFGFGPREASSEPGIMRLAFVLDGYSGQVGVAVQQGDDGRLRLTVSGVGDTDPDDDAVRGQTARVLSADVDATGWDALGQRDALIGRLQAARPGLRPPLFHSAYEALAWAVLSARRPRAQMGALQARLSAEHGAQVAVAGHVLPVFPTPEQLLAVDGFPGLPAVKIERLHGVARAALDGELDTAVLRELDPAEAQKRLQRLDGIGPFYSELVTVRTLGHTDVLPLAEHHSLEIAGQLLGHGAAMDRGAFERHAEQWRPWRTWAAVALRAAGPLVAQ